MPQASPCVLLRFEGPCSWDLLRTCAQSLTTGEATNIHWITDAVLPVDTEASENYVWNSIARRIGDGNDRRGLQLLLHQYSRSRTLAALVGHSSLSSDQSLLQFVNSALSSYSDVIGMPARTAAQNDRVFLGSPLPLPDGDWSWPGLGHMSDELLRLVAACYICLHLFTGYHEISMDIFEPADEANRGDGNFSLSLALNGQMPIKDVERSLRAICKNSGARSSSAALNSLGCVVGHAVGTSDGDLQIGDLSVSVIDRQRVGPWVFKLALPPRGANEPPRIESTAPLDTAAALLKHVYDSLTSVPDVSISTVTISSETLRLPASSMAAKIPRNNVLNGNRKKGNVN